MGDQVGRKGAGKVLLGEFGGSKGVIYRRHLSMAASIAAQSLTWPLRKRAIAKSDDLRGGSGRIVPRSPGHPNLLTSEHFQRINDPGFGDQGNSIIWSMKWWKGKLYAGTGRAVRCVENYLASRAFPRSMPYPPKIPELRCTPNIYDLSLEGELWCYTPEKSEWNRLYRSPADVEIPDHPGRRMARDRGYRYLEVVREADGREALYASGVSTRPITGDSQPPRILRSTDGVVFEPIPQEPGTVLGEIKALGFRHLFSHGGRLFLTAGGAYGSGVLFESRNPEKGNNHFEQLLPDRILVFTTALFNKSLYLGLLDFEKGYSVVKMNIDAPKPYPVTPIVTEGGYRGLWKSDGVISMKVFNGSLYVGCDSPAELIRIHPDDSWDLIVGAPRMTPQGRKFPLSGMADGFDSWLNIHIHSMEVHEDILYMGTDNAGHFWYGTPIVRSFVRPRMGLTLCATSDGERISVITRDGFGRLFNTGCRNLESTPLGLFLGTTNHFEGAQIFLGSS